VEHHVDQSTKEDRVGRDLLPTFSKEKSYQPIKWTGQHRRIVSLEAAGFRPKEIAEILNISIAHVSVILNDARADEDRKVFAAGLVERVQDVTLKIALHADEALEEIIDEMRNVEDPRVRQRAAFGILDRAGYGPIQKSMQSPTSVPPELLHSMQGVLNEMKGIEAEYTILESESLEDPDE